MQSQEQVLLQIQNLGFAYPKRVVFEGISADAKRGLACVGSNGSGKSTLLKLMAGLLRPNTGRIVLSGQCAYRSNVFFDAQFLCSEYSVSQHFRWLAAYCGDKAVSDGAGATALKNAGLWTRCVGELSAGEADFVAIVFSMATSCDLLILDEPLRHLDAQKQACFFELLGQTMAHGVFVALSMHERSAVPAGFDCLYLGV